MRPSTLFLMVALMATLCVAGLLVRRERRALAFCELTATALERESEARAAALTDRERQNSELAATVEKLEAARADQEKALSDLTDLQRERDTTRARAEQLASFVAQFRHLTDAGKLAIEVRRGRLVLVLPNDVLFDEGKVSIKSVGESALAEIAATLKGVRDRQFQVVGHTDSTPIKTVEFPSNWELSASRALAVVRLLLDSGVPGSMLSATGRGEWEPRSSNGSSLGRARNRRIEIVLERHMGELLNLPQVTL